MTGKVGAELGGVFGPEYAASRLWPAGPHQTLSEKSLSWACFKGSTGVQSVLGLCNFRRFRLNHYLATGPDVGLRTGGSGQKWGSLKWQTGVRLHQLGIMRQIFINIPHLGDIQARIAPPELDDSSCWMPQFFN